MAIGQLPYLLLTTRYITALSRAIILYLCTNVTFLSKFTITKKLQGMDKVEFLFAYFQILGPLGCQGWVVMPKNVK
jgi:hypothetical protein